MPDEFFVAKPPTAPINKETGANKKLKASIFVTKLSPEPGASNMNNDPSAKGHAGNNSTSQITGSIVDFFPLPCDELLLWTKSFPSPREMSELYCSIIYM